MFPATSPKSLREYTPGLGVSPRDFWGNRFRLSGTENQDKSFDLDFINLKVELPGRSSTYKSQSSDVASVGLEVGDWE